MFFILLTLALLCEGFGLGGFPLDQVNNVEKMKINGDSQSKFQSMLSHLLLRGEPNSPANVINANKFSPFLLKGEPISRSSAINANKFSPFLLKGEPISSKLLGQKIVPKPCGSGEQIINITSITIKPYPLYLPGYLTIGFDVTINDNVPETAQLTADLELEWKAGSHWVKIPCIGNIGSCSYSDLCSLTQTIPACPPEFQANGIPCKCPFNKGHYKLPELTVQIDASVFLSGEYSAKVSLTESDKGQVACYTLTFTIG